MLPANDIAFKEWAVICDSLSSGRQALILRKGGIHEGRDGFRVAHPEFWLFPTYLHESEGSERVIEAARGDLERVAANRPQAGSLRIGLYAVVRDVHEVRDQSTLRKLAGTHIWSDRSIDEKFHYRQPGLFALTVRIYRRREPLLIAESPHFAGCRSWVDLPQPLPTEGLKPVLDDTTFSSQRQAISHALQHSATA